MRPFLTIWVGQAISLLGSQLVQFALIWWLTQETGSGTALALATIAGLVPAILLGPFAGVLVDRWNRRLTMILADATVALATVALAVLFWTGSVAIWHVYVILFIRSLAGTFHWPALQASTTLMVPEEHLGRIQGLNQMVQGGLNIVAAPLGALLIMSLPVQGILAIDVVTALVAISTLLIVAVPQPPREARVSEVSPWRSFWDELAEGLRYVRAWRGLMILMGVAMLINMVLSPSSSLLPLLITNYFQGSAMSLGTIEAALGVGILLGGLALSAWGGFRRQVVTGLVGVIGIGLGSLVVGLTPASLFAVAVAGMFVVGVMSSLTNGPIMAVIQKTVEPSMQGRVFTLLSSAAGAMMPLGLAIAGPLADAVGVQTWFVIGGVLTTAIGAAGFFMPALMRIEDGPPGHAPIAAPVEAVRLPAD
jgi:DHA3 family macrolide efflux protein-like MFS transporter